jgi:histidine triad (HIT) family protein
MSSDCLFCKILNKEIPATSIYEDEKVFGFKDLHPQAEIHNLFIHKEHTANINEMAQNQSDQLGDVFNAIANFTQQEGLDNSGFRVVTNHGKHAGQTVFHTHFHLLGGESLGRFGS